MEKPFENNVSRFRKCAEMIDELKEYVTILTAERDRLEGEIISELAAHPEAYNVFTRKTSSAGIVGRELFTVAFSDQLARRTKGKALDDQGWLRDDVFAGYRQAKLSLMKSKINADYKAGILDEKTMKVLDLTYAKVGSLIVRRVPKDSELAEIRAAAEALADTVED